MKILHYLRREELVVGTKILYIGYERGLYTQGEEYEIVLIRDDSDGGDLEGMVSIGVTDNERDRNNLWMWGADSIIEQQMFVAIDYMTEEDKFAYKIGGIEALEIIE